MPSLLASLSLSMCGWSPETSLQVSKFTGLKSLMLLEPLPRLLTGPLDLEHLGQLEKLESFGLVLTSSLGIAGFPTLKVSLTA